MYVADLCVAHLRLTQGHVALYSQLCTIEVDLSHLKPSPKAVNASSSTYYKVDYELIMLFGGTELKAQLAWKENVSFAFPFFLGMTKLINGFFKGVEKRSAAKIVYSD